MAAGAVSKIALLPLHHFHYVRIHLYPSISHSIIHPDVFFLLCQHWLPVNTVGLRGIKSIHHPSEISRSDHWLLMLIRFSCGAALHRP